MLKKRLIPCLLLQNGQLVKSIGFKQYQIIGNPKIAIKFFNAWAVDEIIFLDISQTSDYTTLLRADYNFKMFETLEEILKESAKICFVPLTVGGGIRNLEQMSGLFKSGADKVSINTAAVRQPELISAAAKKFGSQAVVVSIDVKINNKGDYEVFIDHGMAPTGLSPVAWAKKTQTLGAGEILLNSIDRDGALNGYDLELIKSVTGAVNIPVIACGGVGKWQDLVDGINIGGASAVAAANIFHFTEQSTRHAKKFMVDTGIDIRL
ncbi:MAG: imidazole glycerol phosphate synthase subunit HisF [Candidatus Komeilibacteria bacterium RIFCSPLOWO2_02_FULL_48_11]|uniref:imidazole glycerol-phosphate synthase n=2 Tax=Parcubacteria group TaxID=1794811 RepID=A0A1G2BSK7_9BACT|nr:MAG: imidazole glycerol phosphate synthase subunit HisF [Candidatus Komeilibacteria bacterium RIFCSPLOWO2_02_FULL_48_11]